MGTHFRGPRRQLRSLETFIKLSRASGAVMARLGKFHAAHHLTASQFGVLETLYHLGPLSQTVLAEKLLVSGANVTTVVDNLERRALVRRDRSTTDRRVVSVSLTEAGRALIAEIFPGFAEAVVETFASLTEAQQSHLGDLCRTLGRAAAGAAPGRRIGSPE